MTVLIITTIIVIILNWLKYKKFFILPNVFSMLWAGSLIANHFVAITHSIYVPSTQIYVYTSIGILAFTISYIISDSKRGFYKLDMTRLYINYDLYRLLFLCSICLMLIGSIKSIGQFISSGFSLEVMRVNMLNSVLSRNGIFNYITRIIPSGMLSAVVLLGLYRICLKEYKYLKYVIVSIVTTLILSGGRMMIVDALIFYVLLVYNLRKDIKIKINKNLIFIAVIVLVVSTFSRGLGSLRFIDMIYKYFCEQFSFFEYILRNKEMFGLNEGLKYGQITFSFILSPFYLLASIFFENVNVPSYYIDKYSQIFYNIGVNGNVNLINNNTSSLYHFLMDFGDAFWLGFVFMALLLNLTKRFIRKNNGKNNAFWLFTYIFILRYVLYSPVYYGLYSIGLSFAIFGIFLMTRRIKIRC